MASVQEEIQKLELISQPQSLNDVERLLDELGKKYNISEDLYGNMLVALTEAVTNAIYHGNKQDPNKKVNITCSHNHQTITFIVSDEGKGFDYYHLPDPTSPENLVNLSGRGIFLMKNLADQLIFSENGRVVEISFRLA